MIIKGLLGILMWRWCDLCLTNNPILDATHEIDDRTIQSWGQRYRNALSEIGPKWRQTTYWWRWLVLAVRFSSFYLDLALLPSKVRSTSETQRGLDPDRIRATVECLRPCIDDSRALAVIDLWLRLSHLRRDSAGFPCIPGHADLGARRSVCIRTTSEAFLQGACP